MSNYWERFTERRLSRKRFLAGAGSLGAAGIAAMAVGCGDDDNGGKTATASSAASSTAAASSTGSPAASATGSPAAKVKTGGTIHFPDNSPPDLFDPAITVHAGSMGNGTTMALAGLLKFDENIKVLDHMANMPEQPDSQTYVFKLKPGIKWHNLPPANGRAFTAADAVFGLQRFTQPNPEFIFGSSLPIDKYEAVDDSTFKLTTKFPFAPLVTAIADDWCMMVNKEMVDKVGDAGIKKYENLLGTGPWIRGELQQGVGSFLTKNPEYFEQGLPYLDRIEWKIVADATARWAAFRSKQFDTSVGWGFWVTKQEADQIKSELGDKVYSQPKRITSYSKIDLNNLQDPFKDARVRKAFHLALDRQAIIAAGGDGNSSLMAAVPQPLVGYAITEADLLKLPGYRTPKDQDIKDAKALLDAAGVKDLKVTATTSQAIWGNLAIATQASMKKIGVDVEFKEGQAGEVLGARAKGDFQMVIASTAGSPDPDPFLFNQFSSKGTANFAKYNSPDFDKLADQQRAELNIQKRQQLVKDAENLLLNDAPMLFTTSGTAYPTAWNYVKDWRILSGWNFGWVSARMWLDK